MRALLEMMAPQVHECDHATTAEILHTGSQESLTVELVRLLMYLETNNMVYMFKDLTGYNINLQDSENMMGFLRRLGFLTKTNVNKLARSADPTSQVFLERLLYHSLPDEKNLDVLGWLVPDHFDINHFVQRHERARSCLGSSWWDDSGSKTLLQASSMLGNIQAVGLLLDLGADPYDNGGQSGTCPLEYAAGLRDHDRATDITYLLLSKPTMRSSEFHGGALDGALEAAITRANNKLIPRLLSERQHLGHGTTSSKHFTAAARHGDVDTIHLLAGHALRTGDGTIMLPEDILFSVLLEADMYYSLDKLCDKLNCILDLGADPAVSVCCGDCGQAFILENLVGKWWRERTQDLQREENYILHVARILREHGCPPERPKFIPGRSHDGKPSSLQLAISRGYPRVVAYLLDWGAEIDYYCQDLRCAESQECKHVIDPEIDDLARAGSPLLTALSNKQTEIAKMLLRRNPNLRLHGGERTLAVENDDTDLVTILLQMEPCEKDECEDLLEHAVSWRSPRSIELLMSMDMNDRATFAPATILRAALICHDHDKIYQQLKVCDYDSRSLFEAVFQSTRSKDYHVIVEHLLKTRQPTPNDRFEICAVALAAYHDMYLTSLLIKSFRQGPWISYFPCPLQELPQGREGHPQHILNYAARVDRFMSDVDTGRTFFGTLFTFGVSAKGMHLEIADNFTAETWKELIAAGADPDLQELLLHAVRRNMLAHVEVLCQAKVPLDMMCTFKPRIALGSISRTAVQVAVESGSPEMLQLLLQYGADVKRPTGYLRGANCLQLAAGAGNIGLVRFFLDKGAQVNAKRSFFDGRTAIEIAAEHGRLDVLKLLLLQDEHLFKTLAERYQFIRAAKFAEKHCHGVIVEMLRQHISWDISDQRLFDDCGQMVIRLDDMTQKPLECETSDPDFFQILEVEAGRQRLKDIYDIEGIEHWIGERAEEVPDVCSRSLSGCGSVAEGDMPAGDVLATSQRRERPKIMRPADEVGIQVEHSSGKSLHSELTAQHGGIRDDSAELGDLHVDQITGQPVKPGHSWSPISGSLGVMQGMAPQAIRHQPKDPMWLEMQDDDLDEMMQDLSGGLAIEGSGSTWEALAHQPAAHTVSRHHGMVLGEVLDEAPDTNDMGDDAVEHNGVDDISADRSHVQHFNWGFWDDELFELHSGQYES